MLLTDSKQAHSITNKMIEISTAPNSSFSPPMFFDVFNLWVIFSNILKSESIPSPNVVFSSSTLSIMPKSKCGSH